MHTTCVNSKDNAKSNDSDHIFVIRENMRIKHRCPYLRAPTVAEGLKTISAPLTPYIIQFCGW